MTEQTASTRPDWATIPNAITLLRFLLLGPVCWLIATGAAGSWWPVILLALWASTDWLDGVLARALGQVSRTGEVLDPIADRLGIAAVVLTLAASGLISWWALALILAADVASVAFAGRAAQTGRIHVTWLGKIRTALLLVAVILLVLAATVWPAVTDAARALLWIGTVLHVAAALDYIRRARRAR